jgi:hypothetical protein
MYYGYPAESMYGFGADVPADVPAEAAAAPQPGVGGAEAAIIIVVGIGLFAIIGIGMYTRYRLMTQIAEKEGWKGALAYEAGSTAVGVGAHAAHRALGPRRYR